MGLERRLGTRGKGAEGRRREDGERAGGMRRWGTAGRLGQASQGFTASAGDRPEWDTGCSESLPPFLALPLPPTAVFISAIGVGFQVHFMY